MIITPDQRGIALEIDGDPAEDAALEERTLSRLDIASSTDYDLTLDRIYVLMKGFMNPQSKYPSILVGGTNGKGSTVHYISAGLRASGIKCGSYFSPHVESITERISVNGKNISLLDLNELLNQIDEMSHHLGISPSSFEKLTAAAFLYFFRNDVDIAVVEVGLGGIYDATNILEPIMSVITNIDMDHEKYLGSALEMIADNKLGICRKKGLTIIGQTSDSSVYAYMENHCRKKGYPLLLRDRDFSTELRSTSGLETEFDLLISPSFSHHLFGAGSSNPLSGECPPPISSKSVGDIINDGFTKNDNALGGSGITENADQMLHVEKFHINGPRYQMYNVSLAFMSLIFLSKLTGWNIARSFTKKTLDSIKIPFRFMIVSLKPLIILDCAHNPAGISALGNGMKGIISGYREAERPQGTHIQRNVNIVCGFMADKDIEFMLETMLGFGNNIYASETPIPRSVTVKELCGRADLAFRKKFDEYTLLRKQGKKGPDAKVRNINIYKDPARCIESAVSNTMDEDILLVTGSIYTMSIYIEYLKKYLIIDLGYSNLKK